MRQICAFVLIIGIIFCFSFTAYADETTTGEDIANYAMEFIDTPYTWGGDSPEEGFDCSGFVNYVYSSFGITVSRTSEGLAETGIGITSSSAEPGDVVLFSNNGQYSHCGIYVGNGEIVHSYNESQGVTVSEISDCDYDSLNIRRIF